MSDLRLVSTTNDMVITQGRPEMVSGADEKAQRIRSRLLTVRGEWFLDTNFGLDYLGVVWVKKTTRAVLEAHIKREILLEADTDDTITQFVMLYDGSTRSLSVTALLQSPDGSTTTVEI